MSDFWSNIIINILCSIIASCIFLLSIFYFLRPQIEIATNIAFRDNKYIFKLCNKSFFRAYDIKIEIYEVTTIQAHGKHILLKNITIDKSINAAPSLAFYGLRPRFDLKETPPCEYALQFKTDNDINAILDATNKFIRIQIEARHGLTGLQSIFIQDFDNTSVIQNGSFTSGKSFKVS